MKKRIASLAQLMGILPHQGGTHRRGESLAHDGLINGRPSIEAIEHAAAMDRAQRTTDDAERRARQLRAELDDVEAELDYRTRDND